MKHTNLIAIVLITVVALSVCAAANVTAAKTNAATPNYSSRLNTAFVKDGYKLVTPFKKTTVYGREAYVGAVIKNGVTTDYQIFPMTSGKSALAYRDQLISSYKRQGYSQLSIEKNDYGVPFWIGAFKNTEVLIAGEKFTPLGGIPVTVVLSHRF